MKPSLGRGGAYRANGVHIVNAKGVKTLFDTFRRRKFRVSGLHEVHPGVWTFNFNDSSGNDLSFYGAP